MNVKELQSILRTFEGHEEVIIRLKKHSAGSIASCGIGSAYRASDWNRDNVTLLPNMDLSPKKLNDVTCLKDATNAQCSKCGRTQMIFEGLYE